MVLNEALRWKVARYRTWCARPGQAADRSEPVFVPRNYRRLSRGMAQEAWRGMKRPVGVERPYLRLRESARRLRTRNPPHPLPRYIPAMRFRSDTPVGIDPRVDVVFKKLFGDPEHERVRLRFLNDVLAPAVPITRAEVRNPFNLSEFEGDRSIVLDIEATDETGRVFQVEMQRRVDRNLSRRMLYDWSRVYTGQLRKGDSFAQLRPVVSVWLCDEDAFPSAQGGHLRFQLLERREGIPLVGDLQIEVLQLRRWIRDPASLTSDPAWTWFCFMNEASGWREVPPSIDNVALEEAMEILDKFRSDVVLSHLYRARVEAERIERGRMEELEEAHAAAARALEEKERALEEKERALEEKERALEEKERAREEKERALAELAALKAKYGLN